MFFSSKPAATQNDASSGEFIFEVTSADFESKVIKASMQKPVIVDFWAPWCGPCKQLMPVLEQAVMALKGEVLLAKVNIDKCPDLAGALRIQSVPTVYAFLGGRPVDAFQGAQPPASIKTFIERLVAAAKAGQPDAIDIPAALKGAAEALALGDLGTAQGIYAQILQQDEKNVEAYVGIVRVFLAAQELEQAQGFVDNAPEAIARHPNFAAARSALELARKAPAGGFEALERKIRDNPADHQARIDLAEARFAAGAREQAVDTLLDAIAQDREWNEQAARKALLKMFEAMGHADPLTVAGRKKLSSLLFS